jgi:SAM-dependent methyltransferase
MKQQINNSEAKPARHIFIADWISRLNQGASFLDAGAGVMRYKHLCKHLQYISQDFGSFEGETEKNSVSDYKWDSKKCDLISDITTIPLDTCSMDYILCSEVLEHLPRPREGIRELARILRKGGELLITAPFSTSYHQEPYLFCSGFSKYFYKNIAEEFNLEIKQIVEVGSVANVIIRDLKKIILPLSPEHSKEENTNSNSLEITEKHANFIKTLELNRDKINSLLHKQPEAYFIIYTK